MIGFGRIEGAGSIPMSHDNMLLAQKAMGLNLKETLQTLNATHVQLKGSTTIVMTFTPDAQKKDQQIDFSVSAIFIGTNQFDRNFLARERESNPRTHFRVIEVDGDRLMNMFDVSPLEAQKAAQEAA